MLALKPRSDGPFTPIDTLFNPLTGRYNITFVDALNKPITLPKGTLINFRYSTTAHTMPTWSIK